MKLVSLLSVLLTSLVPCMGASGQATKPAARSVKTSKPNVIFILVDDMGWGDLDSNWSQQKLNGRTYELFTDSPPVAGEIKDGGNPPENYTYALECSKKMMRITDTAINLMRRKHKKGEFYYWILYYAYLSPQQCENAGAILQSLETKGISISLRTYYVHRDEAIEILSSILWGYTSQDCEKITKLLTLD